MGVVRASVYEVQRRQQPECRLLTWTGFTATCLHIQLSGSDVLSRTVIFEGGYTTEILLPTAKQHPCFVCIDIDVELYLFADFSTFAFSRKPAALPGEL